MPSRFHKRQRASTTPASGREAHPRGSASIGVPGKGQTSPPSKRSPSRLDNAFFPRVVKADARDKQPRDKLIKPKSNQVQARRTSGNLRRCRGERGENPAAAGIVTWVQERGVRASCPSREGGGRDLGGGGPESGW